MTVLIEVKVNSMVDVPEKVDKLVGVIVVGLTGVVPVKMDGMIVVMVDVPAEVENGMTDVMVDVPVKVEVNM